jgi:dihydropyrimidinase
LQGQYLFHHMAGCKLYVVHVSCQESAEPIELAREKGWDVWGQTCTQYFFIDESYLERPGFEGAKYGTCRRRRSGRGEPGGAVAGGRERRAVGDLLEDPKRRPRPGEPAADDPRVRRTRRPNLAEPHGRAPVDEPSALLRPLPAQSTIAVGSDADIVIVDPDRKIKISAATHHSKSDYTPFEGTEVTGAPAVVLLRGRVLAEGDELVAQPGVGEFIRRACFGEELRRSAAAPVG